MARTQVRLDQVTGSFGDFEGGIVDNLPVAATLAAIPAGSGSMVSAMSQLASAVQRVHGGTAFSTNAAGVFSHAIKPDSAGGQDIGTISSEWGDLYIGDSTISIGLGQEHTIADGNTGLLIDSSEKIEINSSGAEISIGNDGVSQAINIGTGAAARTITVGNTTGATTLDINLGTGGLDVDATNGPIALDTTNTGTGITIGTVNSGVPISIGHSTSEVTVNDNLTVTGDLTVNGTTTTIDTTNLLVEDPVIGMAVNAASQNQNGGLAIFSGSSDSDLVIGRVANDVWGFGKKATLKGTVTDLSDMTVVSARASSFEIGGPTNKVDLSGVSGADLRIAAAADLKLEAAGGQVYITGSLVPSDGATYSIGEIAKGFLNLYVSNPYIGGVSRYDGLSSQVLVKSGSGGFLLKNSVEFADGQSGPAASNGFITFQDALLTGSNSPSAWTAFNGTIPLASAKSEWDTFQSNFGQVSLVNAINAASTGTPGAGKATAVHSGGTLSAGSIFTLSGFSHQDVTDASRTSQVDVFVNGQLLLSGALNVNDYTLDGLANNQIKFSFNLENDDVITGIIR